MRQKPSILLINKVDLEQQLTLPQEVRDAAPVVRGSALTGTGIDLLRSELVRAGEFPPHHESTPMITITRERHRLALEAAAQSLERATASLHAGHPPDVVAVDIMSGLDHLGAIDGRTSPEAVLDRVFSEFCIGK
jgi:tRNA modification GTPase